MGSILYYTLNKERQTGKSCDTSNPSLPQYYVNRFYSTLFPRFLRPSAQKPVFYGAFDDYEKGED